MLEGTKVVLIDKVVLGSPKKGMEIGNIFGYKFYADNIYGYKNLRKRAGNSKFKFTFLQGYEILSQP